jgi:hypothetical protein
MYSALCPVRPSLLQATCVTRYVLLTAGLVIQHFSSGSAAAFDHLFDTSDIGHFCSFYVFLYISNDYDSCFVTGGSVFKIRLRVMMYPVTMNVALTAQLTGKTIIMDSHVWYI